MGPLIRSRRGFFPPVFKKTMEKEDSRRPRMNIGLGIWIGSVRKFYPLETIRSYGGALIDDLDNKNLLIYVEPTSGIPATLYTDANNCSWNGNDLQLDTGEAVRSGILFNKSGARLKPSCPMQLFTQLVWVFTYLSQL